MQRASAPTNKPAQDAVFHPRSPNPRFGVLQRKCACAGPGAAFGECEACKAERAAPLQRAVAGRAESTEVPPIVHEVLRLPGAPLDASTRAYMEPRFKHDFSKVRVHADAKAAASARGVNALAYTVGQDVVFANRYSPESHSGRELLAHELVHVMQQSAAPTRFSAPLALSEPDDASERQAESVAKGLLAPHAVRNLGEPLVQRVADSSQVAGEAIDAAEKSLPEGNFIICYRAMQAACQPRYDAIKSTHKDKPFGGQTYDDIVAAMFVNLGNELFIACDSSKNFYCCGVISSVIVREAPPGSRWVQDYAPGYGPDREEEEGNEGLGEQEVKVRGGSYLIDMVVDVALTSDECCETFV